MVERLVKAKAAINYSLVQTRALAQTKRERAQIQYVGQLNDKKLPSSSAQFVPPCQKLKKTLLLLESMFAELDNMISILLRAG